MKLRLIKAKNEMQILCSNGSIIEANHKTLSELLVGFKKYFDFKGSEKFWSNTCSNMEDVKGETLAYVDDRGALVILNQNTFASVVMHENYISTTEYANKVGKSRPSIKNMCAAGRIPGAYKTSSGWLIPENAPYPEDGRSNNGGYHPSTKTP